jgi:hypothetical protein
MKPKELEALAEAVQAESYRKHALDIQKRGCPAFPNIDVQTTHVLGLDADGIEWDRIAERVTFHPYVTVGYSTLVGVSDLYDHTYSKRM